MERRHAPLMMSPALAALALVAFALSGLLLGLLSHRLVSSAAAMPHAIPTHTHATATRTVPATPTLLPATGAFALSLTISPLNVQPGGTLTVAAHADARGTDGPLANLVCVVSGDGSGRDLLASWPAPMPTDAQGNATWHITVPSGDSGTYAIKVRAKTTSYSAYQIVFITVAG